MNFLSQRDMVAGSLLRSDTSAEAHGTYLNRVVRGTNAQPTPQGVESHPRVHASGSEETGCDGRSPTPSRECSRCDGTGWFVDGNGARWKCSACDGKGVVPVARQIPGTRRVA
jgi:hypothetical protein